MWVKIQIKAIDLLTQIQALIAQNQRLILVYSTQGLPVVVFAWATSRIRPKAARH